MIFDEDRGFVRIDGDPTITYELNENKTNEIGVICDTENEMKRFFETVIGENPEKIIEKPEMI